MKVKEESEKVGLKFNIQKTKIKASSPITSWQIDGERVENFILGGSKITADGNCSHEIKRCLFFGRKVMTNLDSILKSRDITLPTKVRLVRAMVFPVIMYGCECWTVKKAEHQRIDAFELWCWRRLFFFFLILTIYFIWPRFKLWVGKILWSTKWQPTPVFLPGKFHGQRSLGGYSPWGHKVRHDWTCTHEEGILISCGKNELYTKWCQEN